MSETTKTIDWKHLTADQKKRLEIRWGDRSTEEYKALERSYASLAEEYKGSVTKRLDMSLRDIALWRLERDKLIKEGDTAGAKRMTEMIQSTMNSEALRVGDTKRAEKMSIDGFAARLEAEGLMEKGVLVLENVIQYVRNDHGKFEMSRDAIDAMILSIVNAVRFNNGLSEVSKLP